MIGQPRTTARTVLLGQVSHDRMARKGQTGQERKVEIAGEGRRAKDREDFRITRTGLDRTARTEQLR
jgi:hypothetical protein